MRVLPLAGEGPGERGGRLHPLPNPSPLEGEGLNRLPLAAHPSYRIPSILNFLLMICGVMTA